ncbi:unnamed protein product [Mytilus coruscus]|uniref:Uncharacterized protein n=1 Tax=Mytilus coruscus TaxID=42192 RepID=A0A6J8EX81_MYTCO|nr:unnamed protein product [Mytilus coruscus]
MTKRKMADRKILQLLYLLYDLCKDSLEEFFKFNCLNGDPSDEKLAKYVTDHKDQLYHHLKYSCCHTCSASNNHNSCAKGTKKLFQCLFTFPEEFSVSDIYSASLKEVQLNNLDIWTVQYLLLADNLEPEQHQWIRTLYEKRHDVSVYFDTISDDNFNTIWIETREIILNILRLLKNRQYEKAVVKQLSLLKMTGPDFCGNEEYWCMMQDEFNVELRPYIDTTLPAPGIKHDTDIDENINNNKQKASVVNVQTDNVFIGTNNAINSISDPAVKRDIEEMLKGHQRVLLERIEQLCVVTYVKQVTETDDKTFRIDRQNKGMDTGQGARSRSCKTKEHKDYFVEWTIKTSDDTDREELEKIAKYIEQERVVDENITIKFVRVGSIVIGTLIPANVVENSDIFNQTARRFIRMIINKCNFNTKFEHVLEVDVTLKPSSECTEISINKVRHEIPTPSTKVMKSHEISTQTNDSEIQLVKTESAYVKMFSNPSAVKESMMSLKVDTFGNQTFYEKVDEKEILYADFPHVKIKALTNYTHAVDEQQVAMMKKDQIYSLIKQVGDWWEITDNPGPSFFVKSDFAVITTPGHVLSPVRKLSTRHALTSTAVQKHHAGFIELLGGADSVVPESTAGAEIVYVAKGPVTVDVLDLV